MKYFILNHQRTRYILTQVQGGQEELRTIQEKDQVKKIDKNLHNFIIQYQNHKLLSSLESLLQGICDPKITRD